MRDTARLKFCFALIGCGFERDGSARDPICYIRTIGDRELTVQLWRDGRHRASHAVLRELPGRPASLPGKRWSTPPTEFHTVAQMHMAILEELSRTDHPEDDFAYRLGMGAASLFVDERERQIVGEGWSREHDDEHGAGQLAMAAAAYAIYSAYQGEAAMEVRPYQPQCWPWSDDWWKPKDRRRNLVRAGALIQAELERLDRVKARRMDARS